MLYKSYFLVNCDSSQSIKVFTRGNQRLMSLLRKYKQLNTCAIQQIFKNICLSNNLKLS